jgi:PAS domain S-box-containing protein
MIRNVYGTAVALGTSILECMTVPVDRDTARRNLDRSLAGESFTQEAFSGEESLARRYFEVSHAPLRDAGGDVTGAVMVATDQTGRRAAEVALRKSEATFRAITGSAQDAIVMINQAGEISFWNRSAERVFGWAATEAMGRNLHDLLAPERFRPSHHQAYPTFQAIGTGAAVGRTIELFGQRKDGTEVPVELSLSSVQLDGAWHAIGILRDVTQRRQTESQLAQAQKMESIGQLAAGIAHEINTPTQYIGDNTRFLLDAFTSLGGLLERYRGIIPVLGEFRPDLQQEIAVAENAADLAYLLEEVPRAIAQSQDGVQRVTQIVRAMREFSHPGSQEKKLVDLNHAIETTRLVARNEWKYTAEFEVDLDPGLPPAWCHAGEINQVLLNLVINAAQAISACGDRPDGSRGRIRVTTRHAGEWAEIRVSDTGCGVPEAVRDRIFDPFFTTKEPGKGTGQGLALAYQAVVKRHGGSITFESEVGRGTTFIVRLPLEKAAKEAA